LRFSLKSKTGEFVFRNNYNESPIEVYFEQSELPELDRNSITKCTSKLNENRLSLLKSLLGIKGFISSHCFMLKFHTQLTNRSNANSVSDRATFPGYKGEFSTNLEFLYPENMSLIQCYRVMNRKGVVLDPSQDPQVNQSISSNRYLCKL